MVVRYQPCFLGFTLANICALFMDVPFVSAGIRAAHCLQVGGREYAYAATFHMIKVGAARVVAQKQEASERLDVRAVGDHF